MDVQNIIIDCVDILSLQNNPIKSFSDLGNVDLIVSLLKLIKNQNDIKSSIDAISYEVQSILDEYFSSKISIDIEMAINGNCVELCILYLLLIYISLFSNANLRNKFVNYPMGLPLELKLTYLMEFIQEKSVSHEDLEILVQKNLDFVINSNIEKNSFSLPFIGPCATIVNAGQTPLKDYIESPSFTSERIDKEKNKEISNLRQQLCNLEVENNHLQGEKAVLSKKKEMAEKERNNLSKEFKLLMKDYEESSNAALKDEKEDHRALLHCQMKIKTIEADYTNISSEYVKLSDKYNELLKELESSQNELYKMAVDRDKFAETADSLHKACVNSDNLLDEQFSEFSDMKNQLENLKECIQEQKSYIKIVEASVDNTLSVKVSQDITMNNLNAESMTFGEETVCRPEEIEMELLTKNKVIKELNNKCQQAADQINLCDHVNIERSEEMSSKKEKEILQINTILDEKANLISKQSQLEKGIEKLKQKVEDIENLNLEISLKYEKVIEENTDLLKKIISIKDEKENLQVLLNSCMEEEYSFRNKHSSLMDEVSHFSMQINSLRKELSDMLTTIEKKDELLLSQDDEICKLKHKNMKLVEEIDDCQKKLFSFKNGTIDNKKIVLSTKEAALVVERDLQKTIDALRDQLQSAKDISSADKKLMEKMKTSFRRKVEAIMETADELDKIEKDNDILKIKYEASKRNLLQSKQELEKEKSKNKAVELELTKAKTELSYYQETQRLSSMRLCKLEDEREPLKLKVFELEAKVKNVDNENNLINNQFQTLESSLRHLQKEQLRGSLMSGKSFNMHHSQKGFREKSEDSKQFQKNGPQKENIKMAAPLAAPAKHNLRSSTKATSLKKSSSVVGCNAGQQSDVALSRTKSVACRPSRLSNYNFNVRNAIPLSVTDEPDAEFVDNKFFTIANDDESFDWRRVSELQRRNSMYPPHMRSDYTAEMQYKAVPFSEDNIRSGDVDRASIVMPNAHTYNLRKRSMDSEWSLTPGDKKARRLTEADSKSKLPPSESWDISLDSLSKKKPNLFSRSKILRETMHGLSPANKVRRTPSNLSKILKSGKSPWKKLNDKKEEGPPSSEVSRKRIFRNPFGSKNYNVKSASLKYIEKKQKE